MYAARARGWDIERGSYVEGHKCCVIGAVAITENDVMQQGASRLWATRVIDKIEKRPGMQDVALGFDYDLGKGMRKLENGTLHCDHDSFLLGADMLRAAMRRGWITA
jgi:hypothetical protein